MTTIRLYARSNAEAHLYMELHPCSCGETEIDRQSVMITDDGVLCSRYAGPCRNCGRPRTFVFELTERVRPAPPGHIDFGGADPSRLLDPGEWLAVADHHAQLDRGTRDDLDVARAAIEEVMKFVPEGAERIPDDAFYTEQGRAMRDAEPDRFRRASLEATLASYRDLLAQQPSRRPATTPPRSHPVRPEQIALDDSQQLVEALATVVVLQQGYDGAELRRHASELADQIQSVVKLFQIRAQEDRQQRN